jgi:hypothetical protein
VTFVHVAEDQIRQPAESRLGVTASALGGSFRNLLMATMYACGKYDAGRRNL